MQADKRPFSGFPYWQALTQSNDEARFDNNGSCPIQAIFGIEGYGQQNEL